MSTNTKKNIDNSVKEYDGNTSKNINDFVRGYEWMKHMPDSMKLTDLSLPGTHNSAAGGYDSFEGGIGSDYAECQKKTVKHQLLTGYRFFDLRIDCDAEDSGKGKMKIFHGDYYCCTLQAVMSDVNEFLEKYPSECVLIRFKQESDGSSESTWVNTFHQYMRDFKGGTDNLPHEHYMYVPSRSSLPTLGQVRGKFLVVSNVSELDGFRWSNAEVQDDYNPSSYTAKKNRFREHLARSVMAPAGNNDLYINFASGYIAPSGPDAMAENMLPHVSDLMKPGRWDDFGQRPVDWFRTGAIMLDIPHVKWEDDYHKYAEKIYLTNKDLYHLGS